MDDAPRPPSAVRRGRSNDVLESSPHDDTSALAETCRRRSQ